MAGRVLSQRNENTLRDAHGMIGDVLDQVGAMVEDDERASNDHVGEVRSYSITGVEVREENGDPIIEGYAAVFNVRSAVLWDFQEIIEPGAFADSLMGDVRSLWNHDSSMVLGRTTNGTLRLWEDAKGLGFALRPPDTQVGRDAVTLIRRGDVNQMSFGFNVAPGGDTWSFDEDNMLLRRIQRVNPLHEVSPVTFPAYRETSANLRSVLRSAPDWVQRALTHGANHKAPNGGSGEDQARARNEMIRRRLELEALR